MANRCSSRELGLRLEKVVCEYAELGSYGELALQLRFRLCHNKKPQESQKGLKLNGAYQLLVYATDVSVLGGKMHSNLNTNRTRVTR